MFATLYALFSGIVFVVVAGVVIAPLANRFTGSTWSWPTTTRSDDRIGMPIQSAKVPRLARDGPPQGRGGDEG